MPSARATSSASPAAWSAGPQPRAPGVGHVVEARPELVRVAADERRPPGQVDVVGHDHQRARAERRIEPAGRVGQDDDPRAEGMEQQDRLDDEARVVALVQVEAALEHDHGPPAEAAQQQPADVARRGRRRPARQVAERDGDRILEVVGQAAQTGAQDDADLGHEVGPRRGRRRRARADGPAGRTGGSAATGRAVDRRRGEAAGRTCGPPGHVQGVDGRGPQASCARREYRHRDADRVPSGAPRGRAVVRQPRNRGQRSARSDRRRNEGP